MKVRQKKNQGEKVKTKKSMLKTDIVFEKNIKEQKTHKAEKGIQCHAGFVAKIEKFDKGVSNKLDKSSAGAIVREPCVAPQVS